MNSPQLLKKVEKLEAFAQAALKEATAIRHELETGGAVSNSPVRGKNKKAALSVLKNRAKAINKKLNEG